jgi:2-polyprenyl-6-methoxyphenol hydroxylase-like FAD-dependent oxidoreductase
MMLLEKVRAELGPDSIEFGVSVEHVRLRPDGALVTGHRRADESPFEQFADVVLAADGIHSAIRKQFFPGEGRPSWNGVTLYRGVTRVPATGVSPAMIWAGHSKQKFACYPIAIDQERNEALLNWICDLQTAERGSVPSENWNLPADSRPLLDRYLGWRWDGIDVPALVEAADGVWEFPMVDRDPLPQWTNGHVTLIGDAAHPMYPIGSNGATQAIIDGRVLARHLKLSTEISSGLEAYERDRREWTSKIVLLNRAHGPDQVLELAQQRAPTPAHDLNRLLPMQERERIAADYKQVAGFDPVSLNHHPSYSV